MNIDDRMKFYEKRNDIPLMPLVPTLARMDGINFRKFTKNLAKPYDKNLHHAMVNTSKYLLEKFGANFVYTQSDEITLGWFLDYQTEIYGGGRVQKLVSHLAAKTTLQFANNFTINNTYSGFDARVWNVPNIIEGANAVLWRQQDAARNSIHNAARHYYSHKQCRNKNTSELQDMLMDNGVNWNNYPDWYKRGTFIIKRKKNTFFSAEELAELPLLHEARKNPQLAIERNYFSVEHLQLSTLSNPEEYLFLGANGEKITSATNSS